MEDSMHQHFLMAIVAVVGVVAIVGVIMASSGSMYGQAMKAVIAAPGDGGDGGGASTVACYSDADCPKIVSTPFCNEENESCTTVTQRRCENQGTASSACVVVGGGLGCNLCLNGCIEPGLCAQVLPSEDSIQIMVLTDVDGDPGRVTTVAESNLWMDECGLGFSLLVDHSTSPVIYPTGTVQGRMYVRSTLAEGETALYESPDFAYEVTAVFIHAGADGKKGTVKFTVNSELTDELRVGEWDQVGDGIFFAPVRIRGVTVNNEAKSVDFYILSDHMNTNQDTVARICAWQFDSTPLQGLDVGLRATASVQGGPSSATLEQLHVPYEQIEAFDQVSVDVQDEGKSGMAVCRQAGFNRCVYISSRSQTEFYASADGSCTGALQDLVVEDEEFGCGQLIDLTPDPVPCSVFNSSSIGEPFAGDSQAQGWRTQRVMCAR
ncbi:MAG: hypothetical protein ABIH41_02185 [Nanoarchaeota archaeon]